VLGLGNPGWEVSHLSQVEGETVEGTVVEVSNGDVGNAGSAVGDWDVGDVSVELGSDGEKFQTLISSVGHGGHSWGQPVGGLLGHSVNGNGSLSVPGSEGSELSSWHGEEWGQVAGVEGISFLL